MAFVSSAMADAIRVAFTPVYWRCQYARRVFYRFFYNPEFNKIIHVVYLNDIIIYSLILFIFCCYIINIDNRAIFYVQH